MDDKSQLKKQRHTARRIFERLRDEHGFTGGITIVTDYVRARKAIDPAHSCQQPDGDDHVDARDGHQPFYIVIGKCCAGNIAFDALLREVVAGIRTSC